MSASLSIGSFRRSPTRSRGGILSAAIVAILFIAVAAISFAIDQSVMLSPPAATLGQ